MSTKPGEYAIINGLKLYYEVHGSGFPLVLIHGGGSTIGTTFGRVLAKFAQTHRVIAVELQAHGHTPDREQPLSFEQDADDVAGLLHHLKIAKADFIGFSNGGTTALQIAIRHPELVRKIVIASGMYKRDGTYNWLWEHLANAHISHMPKELQQEYLRINPDQNALQKMHDRDVERMMHFKDIEDEAIKQIQAPTFVLLGDADVVLPEHAVEMYRQIPNARLAILPGGHGEYFGEITFPAAANGQYPAIDMINDFLRK